LKRGELAVKLVRWEPLAPCAACFLLTAVLCGAQLFGGYAPFALGLVAAAGSGKRGLAALLGGVAGALVFLDFSHALRTLAVAVLLYTANNAFCETRWYRSRRFLPAMTALMYLAVELVYLLQAGADRAALCLLSIALAVLAAVCARAVLERKTMNEEQRQAALLVVVTGVLMAASALRLEKRLCAGAYPCDAARAAARLRPQRRNGAGGGARHRACHGSDGAAGELPPCSGLRLRRAFDGKGAPGTARGRGAAVVRVAPPCSRCRRTRSRA